VSKSSADDQQASLARDASPRSHRADALERMLSAHPTGANTMGDNEHGHPRTSPPAPAIHRDEGASARTGVDTPKPSSPSGGKQASAQELASRQNSGDGQQGTGGIANGEATSTPSQQGSQPHLGSQPGHAGDAPGGSGENEGANEDRVGVPSGPDEIDAVGGARNR
jgi:hypothetical protein